MTDQHLHKNIKRNKLSRDEAFKLDMDFQFIPSIRLGRMYFGNVD